MELHARAVHNCGMCRSCVGAYCTVYRVGKKQLARETSSEKKMQMCG